MVMRKSQSYDAIKYIIQFQKAIMLTTEVPVVSISLSRGFTTFRYSVSSRHVYKFKLEVLSQIIISGIY